MRRITATELEGARYFVETLNKNGIHIKSARDAKNAEDILCYGMKRLALTRKSGMRFANESEKELKEDIKVMNKNVQDALPGAMKAYSKELQDKLKVFSPSGIIPIYDGKSDFDYKKISYRIADNYFGKRGETVSYSELAKLTSEAKRGKEDYADKVESVLRGVEVITKKTQDLKNGNLTLKSLDKLDSSVNSLLSGIAKISGIAIATILLCTGPAYMAGLITAEVGGLLVGSAVIAGIETLLAHLERKFTFNLIMAGLKRLFKNTDIIGSAIEKGKNSLQKIFGMGSKKASLAYAPSIHLQMAYTLVS